MYRSINPSTEEVMGEFPEHSPEQIESALRRSQAAFLDWRELSSDEIVKLVGDTFKITYTIGGGGFGGSSFGIPGGTGASGNLF